MWPYQQIAQLIYGDESTFLTPYLNKFNRNEQPFTSYFDFDKGTRALTHTHTVILKFSYGFVTSKAETFRAMHRVMQRDGTLLVHSDNAGCHGGRNPWRNIAKL